MNKFVWEFISKLGIQDAMQIYKEAWKKRVTATKDEKDEEDVLSYRKLYFLIYMEKNLLLYSII